ncbi:MAG TPA: twin-arginine translocase subunit TatC [Bacteroidales bacterium]|nr:MAG: twin-arginine translocase subunit TatC [Bacteroidetes bacterium HGW-Bacteroidetes-22]HAQ65120.1 twin-arginine translocase subunit TatC [Bacteroidales bacterium]HBZ65999.1 twin-arginine translocase subunit TatC [Bacteroidales bacterium]
MAEILSNRKKGKPKPEAQRDMSFWDHLSELRWRLVRSVIVVIIIAIVAMMNREFVFDQIILAPLSPDFLTIKWLCEFGQWIHTPELCLDNSSLQIINITMSGQFMTHMYISLMAGVIAGFPYIIWELWRFVKPALHERERRYSSGAVLIISALFLLGAAFSYYLLVPLTVNFLGTYQVSGAVQNQVALSSYISTLTSLTFSVGLVFELPVLVFVLAKIGIISAQLMRKFRKVMAIIILILAGIITPPDIFSQIMVTIPLMALYELSIIIAAKVGRKAEETSQSESSDN